MYDFSIQQLTSSFEGQTRLLGTAEDLTPEKAATLGAVFGNYLGGEDAVVVTARDYRKDTRMVSRAFNAGLISVGTTVFELHACSFPVLEFALRRFSAHAGVHFATSHREPKKIAIRFLDETGSEITWTDIYPPRKKHVTIKRAPPEKIADIISIQQANEIYLSAIHSALKFDAVKERNFSIVVDCSLGPVAEVLPNLLSSYGCKVLTLNAYKPESIPESLPSPNSLMILSRTVIAAKADLGVVFDPKGSRVLFVDEMGKVVDPHIVASILIKQKMVGREPGAVVLVETLWMLEEWLKSSFIPTYLVEDMPGSLSRTVKFHRALFAANDKGNYIHPTFSNESEPFVTTLFILWALAQENERLSILSEKNNYINKLYITEDSYRISCDPAEFFSKLYSLNVNKKVINTLNGIKIQYSTRSWVHIFTDLIPNIINIHVCSKDQEERKDILLETKELIKKVENEILMRTE